MSAIRRFANNSLTEKGEIKIRAITTGRRLREFVLWIPEEKMIIRATESFDLGVGVKLDDLGRFDAIVVELREHL